MELRPKTLKKLNFANMLQHFFLNSFDQQAAAWFLANRTGLGVNIFLVITAFGNWQFLLPALLLVILILYHYQQKKFIVSFGPKIEKTWKKRL